MAKDKNIRHWVVITGSPVFVSKTRKSARKYAKENKAAAGKWNYVGKCVDRKIILEI